MPAFSRTVSAAARNRGPSRGEFRKRFRRDNAPCWPPKSFRVERRGSVAPRRVGWHLRDAIVNYVPIVTRPPLPSAQPVRARKNRAGPVVGPKVTFAKHSPNPRHPPNPPTPALHPVAARPRPDRAYTPRVARCCTVCCSSGLHFTYTHAVACSRTGRTSPGPVYNVLLGRKLCLGWLRLFFFFVILFCAKFIKA